MIDAKLIFHSNIEIIKQAGEIAYRTTSKKTTQEYIEMLMQLEHTSVLEHCFYTFEIVCDRAMSHEIVRHRIASYTQESTRYVDFTKKEIAFNIPETDKQISEKIDKLLLQTMDLYSELKNVYGKDVARSILPNMTQTKVMMTINARSLLNFFKLRNHLTAHKDMRKLSLMMFNLLPDEHKQIYKHLFEE